MRVCVHVETVTIGENIVKHCKSYLEGVIKIWTFGENFL